MSSGRQINKCIFIIIPSGHACSLIYTRTCTIIILDQCMRLHFSLTIHTYYFLQHIQDMHNDYFRKFCVIYNIQLYIFDIFTKVYTLSKKRNAYSISHGFFFKVNKKTYYVKSIEIKNIYQQSQSHKFWNWTHVWKSEVLRYVRMVPQNDNSMIRSNVNIECAHSWHQALTAHGASYS
jgi:hypothetical protein